MNLYIGSQCRLPATIKSVRKTFQGEKGSSRAEEHRREFRPVENESNQSSFKFIAVKRTTGLYRAYASLYPTLV